MSEKYQQQKKEFLDSLSPDDFRNPANFNQVEIIIDKLNLSVKMVAEKDEFITKALKNLFREGSPAFNQAFSLYKTYMLTL